MNITDEQWAAVWRHAEMWRGAKNFGGTIADALLHLKAQLAAMTAERDVLEKERHQFALQLCAIIDCPYIDDLSMLAIARRWQARLTASEAALRKYGRHLPNCHYEPGNPASCTCGFAALAEPGKDGT